MARAAALSLTLADKYNCWAPQFRNDHERSNLDSLVPQGQRSQPELDPNPDVFDVVISSTLGVVDSRRKGLQNDEDQTR